MKYLFFLKVGLLLVSTFLVIMCFINVEWLDMAMRLAYVLIFATVGLAVLMPLYGIVQNPKSAINSLVGVGLVAVVVIIAYAMSSADPIITSAGDTFDSELALRFSDTALYTTYFAFVGVILSIVGGEVYKLFK